jgi:hypothetical protein
VVPLILNCADLPSSEGESTFSAMEYTAEGPAAFAPAQTVQFSHPGIWSISLFTVAPEGAGVGELDGVGVGEAEGVGVGDGEDELPTVKTIVFLKTAPVESQACTTVVCWPAAMVTKVFRLPLVLLKTLIPST